MIIMPRVNSLPKTTNYYHRQTDTQVDSSNQGEASNSRPLEITPTAKIDYTQIGEPEDPFQDVPDLEPATHDED